MGSWLRFVFQVETADKEEEGKQSHWQEDDKPHVVVHKVIDSAVIESLICKAERETQQEPDEVCLPRSFGLRLWHCLTP
jgi:hypothetical protein